jgi:putative DNA primase/helicase
LRDLRSVNPQPLLIADRIPDRFPPIRAQNVLPPTLLGRFIDRHGDSRFSATTGEHASVRDRAGWWREDSERGRLYLFNADGLREALKGFDFKRALDVLEQAGVIPKAGADGERAKPQRIDGRPVRVYEVRADVLGKGHGN